MNESLSGECLCGKIKYEYKGPVIANAACYCHHCQKQSGSALSIMVLAAEGGFKFVQGTPKVYNDIGDSGKTVYRNFCGDCGSPLLTSLEASPGLIAIKAGTLSDLKSWKSSMQLYCSAKIPALSEPLSEWGQEFEKGPPS